MTSSRKHPRAGFTLIELMMVIGIIAFLIAVTWVALANVLGGTKIKATQATIRKIDGLLTKRLEAMERDFERRGGSFSTSSARGVLNRKQRMMQLFPQMLEESSDQTNNGATQTPADASEALYYFLTQTAVLDTEDLDSDMFTSTEVMDTDGDGNLEFVDAWGEPLRFYRWPTRLIRPAANPTDNQDIVKPDPADISTWYYTIPIDPDFRGLNNTGGASARVLIPSIQQYADRYPLTPPKTIVRENLDPAGQDADDPLGQIQHAETLAIAEHEENYHTQATWSLPLIVSAGIDRELGLYEPWDKANHGHLAQPIPGSLEALLDNITNRNLQSGGQ